jgi:hypothetical protein
MYHLLYTGFWLGLFWTLKMEVIRSSETSVDIRTTRLYIPEDGNIQLFLEFGWQKKGHEAVGYIYQTEHRNYVA